MKHTKYLYNPCIHLVHFRTFIKTFNPQYGNCYTFNAGKSNVFKQSQTGPTYGITLIVDICCYQCTTVGSFIFNKELLCW